LRVIDGEHVALCAALTEGEKGDLYIDDAWHYALGIKFGFEDGFFDRGDLEDEPIFRLMLQAEEKLPEGAVVI